MKALSPVAAKHGKTPHGVRQAAEKTGEPQTSLSPRSEAQVFVAGSGLLPHSVAHIPAAPLHLPLQRKLAIGDTNDPLEAEADRMADHVLRMKDPVLPAAGASVGPVLQRKCACEGTGTPCKECEDAERGKKLHRKTQSATGVTEAPPIVHEVLRSPGESLDSAARAWFEPRFDHDFRSVRVHADARAADSARSVNALAYTVGNHIVFAGGRFDPAGQAGRKLLAHELTHVMQQQGHKGSLVQRQSGEMKPVQVGPPDPEECEGRTDISKEFRDFVRAVPALLQSAPDFTPEQRTSFRGQLDGVLQSESGIDINTFKAISCDKINSELLIGGETARAEVRPDKKEILLSKRTKQLIDDFKQKKDKQSLGELIETLAHEKRHVTLGAVLKVDPQGLRPGRPETVAQKAEYRAQEILAVAEEIAVGRLAFGHSYAVAESKQQKLRRQNNIMRGYVTEAEYKRLRSIIIAKLRQRYGFEHNCDNPLTVGVVSSMDHNRWFECVSGAPGGINPPVASDLHVCDDFCKKQTRPAGPTENEEGSDDGAALQRKAQAAGGPAEAPPIVHEVLRSPGQPLDPATRAFFEPRFGADFSSVRVHTGPRAAESARSVNALAYTTGTDIVFASGQYNPHSARGHRLLAHELAHTVQQLGVGRTPPAPVRRAPADGQLNVRSVAPVAGVSAPSPQVPPDRFGEQTTDTGQLTQPEQPKPTPVGVDRMVFSCKDMLLRIESGSTAKFYKLETCSLPIGSYTADVRIDDDDFNLTFPESVSAQERFDFSYRVLPGQANPSTMLKGQTKVQVDVVEHLNPVTPSQPAPCIVTLRDRQLVAPESKSVDLFKPLKFDRTVWSHPIPLGEFGFVDVDLKASGDLNGTLSGQYGPGMLTDICLTHQIGNTPSSAPIKHPLLRPGSHADVNTFTIGGRARFTLPASAHASIIGSGKVAIAADYLGIIEVAAIEGGLAARGDASLSGNLNASVEIIAVFTQSTATLEPRVIPIQVVISKSSLDKIDLAAEVALKGHAGLAFALDATAAARLLGFEIWREKWNLRNEVGLGLGWAGGIKYSPNPGIHWVKGAIGKMEGIDALMTDDDATVETDDVLNVLLDQAHGSVTAPDGLSPKTALPFDWHKPMSDYIYPRTLNITKADDPKILNRDDGPTSVRYTQRGRTQYDRIGVAGSNWAFQGKPFQYVPYSEREEPEKNRLRRLLDTLGYNRAGTDVDHIHELQFGGSDTFSNLWPADNSANRSAGTRHQKQLENYEKQLGNLAGRHFVIARIQI